MGKKRLEFNFGVKCTRLGSANRGDHTNQNSRFSRGLHFPDVPWKVWDLAFDDHKSHQCHISYKDKIRDTTF